MKETITFDDFQKLELRVGTILKAERIEGSSKLLRMQVDIGYPENRQILAGIGVDYTPEEMVGKQLVVVVNLEPKKMMGEESQGMLLAADDNGKAIFVSPEQEAQPGTIVT